MKRPEGFDHRTDADERRHQPAAQQESRDGGASSQGDGFLGGLGRRFGRGRQDEVAAQDAPDDGLEARRASDDAPPAEHAVSEPAADPSDASRASRLAGVAGKRFGAGLASVRGRFQELSPDEDYVDPNAPVRSTPSSDDDDHIPDAGARAAETAREARAARKRRRLVERQEVRRFTRRSRHRRSIWITSGAVLVVLVLSIVVAVFSPLMALTKIEIKGTDRIDRSQLLSAVDGQLGTPLARIDFGELKHQLAGFPLIESYVTEEAPPHTLVITVTEREPIVAVQTASGFDLVDPAGIVVESDPNRPDGMPLADVTPSQIGGAAYRTMASVVLALPASVRSTVTDVTATTSDDVTLTLNSGAKVVWGSPDDSDAKAALLAALVKDHEARDPSTAVEYDVSAPDNGIIRTQS
ncbi:FtsQ-type POTRA domain-containing protein [Curtobacterium sp. Leaf261]|uniref:FtsQ-type POTRA domain-containing protein n=1 Tax=Curtobacterium sp. Leaf261 TaxID=1736311 RepID=UPI0006F96799|nr:FtsQ-type POTRA domain-containing protein [Curtobacterium sp. Leaf261]KQO65078.1 hypothetical protein ASF23_02785 [Curtobacterium sp. Leaf261]